MVTKRTRLVSGIAAVLMLISMMTAVVLPAGAANAWDQYETVASTGLYDASALPNITDYASGTATYQVNSVEGIKKIRDLVYGGTTLADVTIYQTADIDMGWEPFTGIGDVSAKKPFSGTYDGNGFTIDGLYVLKNNDQNGGAGLFGYVSAGTIKNVGIASGLIIGNQWTGSVIGSATSNTKVLNCWNAATIVGGNSGTGGIAGRMADNNSAVVNCYNLGTIIVPTSKSAGIVGWINNAATYVANCYNAGEIVSGFYEVAKHNELHEYSAILNADFTSERGVDNDNNYFVTGRGKTGSVADLFADAAAAETEPTVPADYDEGAGELLQTTDAATGVEASALTDATDAGLAAKLNAGARMSEGAVDGYTVAFAVSDIGYPVLTYSKDGNVAVKRVAHTTINVNGERETWENKSTLYATLLDNVNGGFGRAVTHPMDNLQIGTANDLFVLALASNGVAYTTIYGNGYIFITNDIDMLDMDLLPVQYFTPISASNGSWSGTLDGQNHVIKNWKLYVAINGGNATSGLINVINGNVATIRDLGLVDFDYTYEAYTTGNVYSYPAGIVDRVYKNFTADNCFATGTFTFNETGFGSAINSNNLGGIMGRSWGAEINITNCWSNCTVVGDPAADGARVAGSNSGGTVTGTSNNYYFADTVFSDGNNPIAGSDYQTLVTSSEVSRSNVYALAAHLNEHLTQKWTVDAEGNVTFAEGNATHTVVFQKMIGGYVVGSERQYANAGSEVTVTIPAGYEMVDDGNLPEGAEDGTFTMPDSNVTISCEMATPDWTIIEELIAEYEELNLDSLVSGEEMASQLEDMKLDLADKDTFEDELALDIIGEYVAQDAGFDKSLKEGYYPQYSMKDSFDDSHTEFAITTKEDWLAAVNDVGAVAFEGITLHFTNDIDMENTNMGLLGGSNGFKGTINGHGYVMKNVYMQRSTTNADRGAGLVGALYGTITDLGIASGLFDITYEASGDDKATGAFAGVSYGGAVFRRCWNAATVKTTLGTGGNSNFCVAGIVGRGYDGSMIDSCFNLGDIVTVNGYRTSDLNNWGQCGANCTGCYVYNSFGAGMLTGSQQDVVKYNSSGIGQASAEGRFPLYNTYSTGTLIINKDAADVLPEGSWDPNDTNILTPEALESGELLYLINTNYQAGKGEHPYFTFDAEGNVDYGNIRTQIRKLTYQIDGEDVAVRYVPGDTDYTLDYALGATYAVTTGDGGTEITGNTLHTSASGDMVIAVTLGDKDYRALQAAINLYEGINFTYIANGAEVQALYESAKTKLEDGTYASQEEIDADAKALTEGYVFVSPENFPSVTEAADYPYLPGYTVSTVDEWNHLASNPTSISADKTVYLAADIDFNNGTISQLGILAPLNGLGHTVSNGSISHSIFGNYTGNAITNINFDNCHATACSWNTALLIGQYAGTELLLENITMTNCSATKKDANGLSLMVAQVAGGKTAVYRNITVENCTLNTNGNGNNGFLGATHGGNITVENAILNNNTITGNDAGWGFGIAFGELTGASALENIGVFNTQNNATHAVQGAIAGVFKIGTLSLDNVLVAGNTNCSSVVNNEGVEVTYGGNGAADTAAFFTSTEGGTIVTTNEVLNGASAYALNAAGVEVKWEIKAGDTAPSFDTDETGLPVQVSFVTGDGTTYLYTDTDGKLVGLTEEFFNSATSWTGYENYEALANAVFTENTTVEGTSCDHDWEYTSRNDGTHTISCSKCEASETAACTYTYTPGASHENHTKTCQYCRYTATEACSNRADHVQDATCTTNKKTGFGCAVCGNIDWTEVADSALGHAWVYTHTEGTENENSTHSKVCSRCEETVASEACSFSSEYTEHTCTENAYTTYTCICGYSYVVEDTSDEGLAHHTFDPESYVTEEYPTYILDGMTEEEKEACKGVKKCKCTYCDSYDTQEIPALTGAGVVYTANATTAEGTQTIEVALELVNNPGIAGLIFDVAYDTEKLTLTGVAKGAVVGDDDYFVGVKDDDYAAVDGSFSVNLLNAGGNLTEADTKDKSVVVLTFTAAEGVVVDPSILSVTTTASNYDGAVVTVGALAPKLASYIWADVNSDKEVNIDDALLILKYLVELVDAEEIDMKAADADRNGAVDIDDALMVLKYLVELVEWDPVGGTNPPA